MNYADIQELKSAKGLALNDILTEIHQFIKRGNFDINICKFITIINVF